MATEMNSTLVTYSNMDLTNPTNDDKSLAIYILVIAFEIREGQYICSIIINIVRQ